MFPTRFQGDDTMPNDQYKDEVIDPGDSASRFAKEICSRSYGNCPAVVVSSPDSGGFRGMVNFGYNDTLYREMAHGGLKQTFQNDGAGGKPQFHGLLGEKEAFRGLGWEILTMILDDLARSGQFPCVVANQIDVQGITPENLSLFNAMMEGYGQALAQAGVINITGEIAVMKHSITAFCNTGDPAELNLAWSGSCVGLSRESMLIDGSAIRPGMPIVGLHEHGYRCNGGTFFTNLLLLLFGNDIVAMRKNPEAMNFVRKLTAPSISYARMICQAIGWNYDGTENIHAPLHGLIMGIAHITGGGVWGKFGELLPEGVGACLNNMPVPPEVLLQAQQMANRTDLYLPDQQAYSTFHGGCGMMVVCHDDEAAESLLRISRNQNVVASVVGETVESNKSEIVIHSRFAEQQLLSSLDME